MSINPYTPPKTAVADMAAGSTAPQSPAIFSARGRIGRLRLLVYTHLALFTAWIATTLLLVGIALSNRRVDIAGLDPGHSIMLMLLLGVLAFMGIAFLVFMGMKIVQRTHDMGHSGWAGLIALLPFAFLLWLVLPGSKQANAHGPRPGPNGLSLKVSGGLFIALDVLIVLARTGVIEKI